MLRAAFGSLASGPLARRLFVAQQPTPIGKPQRSLVAALKGATWRTTYSTNAPLQPENPEQGQQLVGATRTAGLTDDLIKVKEAFTLSSVPRESLYLGLAGTLPYLGSALSTVYLSWIIKTEWTSSDLTNSFLFTHEAAIKMLDVLGSVQMHYGAVIISFLGAIHWGLEYAETTPVRGRTLFRYGQGLAASLLAWPTLMLPIELALTSQFVCLAGQYMADWRATNLGWAPAWYGRYRFVLTAIVGVSIFVTLLARAKAEDKAARLSTDQLNQTMDRHTRGEVRYRDFAKEEEEERERLKKEKEEAEKKKVEDEKKSERQKSDDQKTSDKKSADKGDEDKEKE